MRWQIISGRSDQWQRKVAHCQCRECIYEKMQINIVTADAIRNMLKTWSKNVDVEYVDILEIQRIKKAIWALPNVQTVKCNKIPTSRWAVPLILMLSSHSIIKIPFTLMPQDMYLEVNLLGMARWSGLENVLVCCGRSKILALHYVLSFLLFRGY